MVICVLTLLIYFTYYMYGRCILSQDSYILAFRASTAKYDFKDDPEGYVLAKCDAQVGSKYFGLTRPSFTVKTNGKEVIVVADAEVRHSAMGNYFLMQKDGWDLTAALKAKRRDYASHIRLCTRLRDLGKEILGIE